MIQVENLSFAYAGQAAQTLRGLSFELRGGEIFGFLGPSGAGKSTTQKILYKLLAGYTGRIEVLGKDLSAWDERFYERVGVGFELPNHYLKLTARENLEFFASFYPRRYASVAELLALVGLEANGDKLVADYSKGMKMRLNFLRAIQHAPDILFLDEPTSGLDPTNAQLIKSLIRRLKDEGRAIFLTTHQMHDADELCDRVAFLADGQIMAMDSPRALRLAHARRSVEVAYTGATGSEEKASFNIEGLGDDGEFLRLLRERHILSIHSQEATLEDIFRITTGKKLSQ